MEQGEINLGTAETQAALPEEHAGFWWRQAAIALDSFILAAICTPIILLLFAATSANWVFVFQIPLWLLAGLVLYFWPLTALRGQDGLPNQGGNLRIRQIRYN
jgi:hypothetical protein